MRIPSVLLVAAMALALSACSSASSGGLDGPAAPVATSASASASTTTSAGASDAIDLVGTVWRVAGHAGETVRFDGLAITVTAGDRSSSHAWSAQGDQVLVGGGGASALDGPIDTTWLVSATRVQRTAVGWTLLDAAGAATARLLPDGSADPTTATTLLRAATPGGGVVDLPANALEGRWTVGGDTRTSITFAAGTWRASASCASSAVGGSGVYRVLPRGRLLVVRTMTQMRGCPIVDGAVPARASAITAIVGAGSFRVRGDTLTLFDRAGVPLGSLVRG